MQYVGAAVMLGLLCLRAILFASGSYHAVMRYGYKQRYCNIHYMSIGEELILVKT
jgi:hypothetical protein